MVVSKEPVKCTDAVIKIASRCNINCTYCYMYNLGDKTYKSQPKVMSMETVKSLMKRVKYHCIRESIPRFHFVLHGGEPLLAGKVFLRDFVDNAKRILLPDVRPIFSIQTNGIMVDDEWCDLFKELGINVGISLDGIKSINDQYRLDHKGKGTYARVVKGIETIQKAGLGLGILSVINIDSDPEVAYEHLKSLSIQSVDFLFPDYTHDQLPNGIHNSRIDRKETPYADWLIKIFDLWFDDDHKLDIRFFKYAVCLLLGGDIEFDYLGTTNNDVLVIETDGGIEPVDSLKVCGHGFTKTTTNVKTHHFDEALETPLARMYHLSKKKVCKQCYVCPVKEICGGGFLPHRYSKKNGFNNPSVYCADLIKLFTHFQNRVMSQFSTEQLSELGGVELVTVDEVKDHIVTKMNDDLDLQYVDELEYFRF